MPKLADVKLYVIVVDDGSDADSLHSLRELVGNYAWVELIECATNNGKGATLITGMQEANGRGFTHAIVVDADGQHNADDIQRFMQASRTSPDTIFSGKPVFGEDIPNVRRYGRIITTKLSQLAAGSKAIKDAMCGFRVYPLNIVLRLCAAESYGKRMEFETEILVYACWQNYALGFIDTNVVYPQSGKSHFRMISDNARMAVMHAKLLLGGLMHLTARRSTSKPRTE